MKPLILPSELFLGQRLKLLLDILRDCPSDLKKTSTNKDYFLDLKEKMNRMHDLAR